MSFLQQADEWKEFPYFFFVGIIGDEGIRHCKVERMALRRKYLSLGFLYYFYSKALDKGFTTHEYILHRPCQNILLLSRLRFKYLNK